MALALCLIAFVATLIAARSSIVAGLAVMFAFGYSHGIVRAHLPETASYFIFDASVLGFYGGQLFRILTPAEASRFRRLKPWLETLIVWPLIMFLIPWQDVLVRMVGLRGNVFMLPFMLIGARLAREDRYHLALWLAGFNLVAFTFAVMEYFYGVPVFFPRNEMTKLIYASTVFTATRDVLRIPATFANAHAFAGTMVMTIPFLAGALVQRQKRDWHKPFLICAAVAALLGVFMSATRLNFIVVSVLVIVTMFALRTRFSYALGWIIIVIGVGWFVAGESRLQRFMELQDTEMVQERVSGSVNAGFFELLADYPFGNGLGGGGTNIPAFLMDRISNRVGMENEYARILLEQGIIGLLLWLSFLIWLFTRPIVKSDPWVLGRRLAWFACLAYFSISIAGVGLFQAIPQTYLVMICVGWVGSAQTAEELLPFKASLSYRGTDLAEIR